MIKELEEIQEGAIPKKEIPSQENEEQTIMIHQTMAPGQVSPTTSLFLLQLDCNTTQTAYNLDI